MLTNGVSTFVVGFGAGINATQMNKFAVAGGVSANDPTAPTRKYYQADDAKSLDAALATIAGAIWFFASDRARTCGSPRITVASKLSGKRTPSNQKSSASTFPRLTGAGWSPGP